MFFGQCLCSSVQFKINRNIDVIYQCYCSLCRKQSGTHSNHATMIHITKFEWITDQQLITTYKKDSGFTSSFCQKCGSPVPNKIGQTDYVWIPLGLIENNIHPTRHINFCLSSKANWEGLDLQEADYEHLPSWDEIQTIFK